MKILQRPTSDPAFARRNIYAKLDKLRRNRKLPEAEIWCVLRSFFALREERGKHQSSLFDDTLDARTRTARLCGRAKSTVGSVVAAWNRAFSSDEESEPELIKIAIEPTLLGNRSSRTKHISDDDALLCNVRDFVQRKR